MASQLITTQPGERYRVVSTPARKERRKNVNRLMLGLTAAATALAIAPLAWIILSAVINGIAAWSPTFFTQAFAPASAGGGGIAHAIVGTVILTALASLIAIPIGVLGAFYVAENPNTTLGLGIRFGTDVLSGLPSIVVGLFVYILLVAGRGYSAFAGSIALAIMMLPIVLRSTEEMLRLVPRPLKEASLGLGAPVWKTSLSILLPAALTGIVTGILLAISRVTGETASLLFTAQGSNVMSVSLDQPMAALPLTLFRYATDPDPFRVTQAWGIALALMVLILSLNIFSRWLANRASNVK